MSTTTRAVLLGVGLIPFSALGTALILTILFFPVNSPQP